MEYGSVAEWVTATATVAGLVLVVLGWRSHHRGMREQHALELYSRCIKLTLDQPQFAYPEWLHTQRGNEWDQAKYSWYQSYLLSMCEQLYLSVGHDDPAWRASIAKLVTPHLRPPLDIGEFAPVFVDYLKGLNPELR